MNKRQVGGSYESMAAEYLKQHGMEILAVNYRVRSGEIDLVARDGETIVFVEVKYRADERAGDPLEAVDLRKQQTIVKTAKHFLLRYGYGLESPCRFDVVGICGRRIMHVRDAFWAG